MNETISTNIKTEADEFKSNEVLLAKRRYNPQLKPTAKFQDKKWDNVFSQLLNKIGSRKPSQVVDGLNSPPIVRVDQHRENFSNYLDGRISSVQLLQRQNYPRLHTQYEESGGQDGTRSNCIFGQVLKFKSKLKKHHQVDDREQFLKSKAAKLKQLIESRVNVRKGANDVKRRESLQNVKMFRSLVEASEQIGIKQIDYPKMLPHTRTLHTMTLSYESKQSSVGTRGSAYTTRNSIGPQVNLKTNLVDSTKHYFQAIQAQQENHQARLNHLTKLSILKKNKNGTTQDKVFDAFHKQVNNQGLLTKKDIELYDYLFVKPEPNVEFKGHNVETFAEERVKTLNHVKRRRLPMKQVITEELDPNISHASSLQSTYEIYLDNLYSQTIDVRKQLRQKTTLPKKIRQMMRLDELAQEQMNINTHKLFQQ